MAFEQLKEALTTTPALALQDFSQQFIVECDASDLGIGVVLQQDIRFLSLATPWPNDIKNYQHTRELVGLIKAVRHWSS